MTNDDSMKHFQDVHRLVAVHASTADDADAAFSIATDCMNLDLGDVVVFAPNSSLEQCDSRDCKFISFPDCITSLSAQKNFILEFCKSAGFSGFLHMIETSIRPNCRTSAYMNKLESTMSALDYDIHFSTASDPCNYVFKKFCPRLTMCIDDFDFKNALDLPDKIHFTSHANTAYTTWNFGALDSILKFNEQFSIGMFIIIEFLARRRAMRRDDQLYYMNQYLAIDDELGGYDMLNASKGTVDTKVVEKENELFKTMNIDYSPDNNVDIVLEALYKKLKSKMQ